MAEPVNTGPNPSYHTMDPEETTLYVANETSEFEEQPGTGGIHAFAVNLKNQANALTKLNTAKSYGCDPCMLSTDHTGSVLACTNYSSGSVSMLRIDQETGALGDQVAWKVHNFNGYMFGDPMRQEACHAHSVVFDPENKHALVCDLGKDKIITYNFNNEDHALLPGCSTWDDKVFDPTVGCELMASSGIQYDADPASGPRHLVFHPDGQLVFSVNELNATIDTFLYETEIGALHKLSSISMLPEDWPEKEGERVAHFNHGRWAADIKVHPNGKFVYASNRLHNSVVSYQIKPNGTLSYMAHQDTLGMTPRSITFTPDGLLLVVANQHSHNLVSFYCDETTGLLKPTGYMIEVPCVACVTCVMGPAEDAVQARW